MSTIYDLDESIISNITIIYDAENLVNDIKKEITETKIDLSCTLCEILEIIKRWSEYIKKLIEVITDISGKIICAIKDLVSDAMQIVLKTMEILILRVKELVAWVKLKIAEISKKLIELTIKGKGSGTDGIMSAISAAYIALGQVVNTVIQMLDIVSMAIAAIPLISIDGKGMAFFTTPKSTMKKAISIANEHKDTGDNLGTAGWAALGELVRGNRKLENIEKKANIAKGAAEGAVNILNEKCSFGSIPNLPKLDITTAYKAIELFLNLLPMPLGLPKYERLSILNIGFMAFMLTGFQLASKQTFGLPGFP